MKNILITGASGFIGSFLVEEGLRRNYQVFAAVRASSSMRYLQDKNIKVILLNLADKLKMVKDFRDFAGKGIHFDYVIHNAGVTKAFNKKEFFKVNYEYTRNLVEALTESGCVPDKFLYMSSLEAFGPGNEKTLQPIRETDTPHPFSIYGKSKLKSEQYLQSLKNFPFLIFRPTGVYGPREKDYLVYIRTISRGFEIYIGRKKQYLSFVYVKDLVRAVYLGLESEIVNKSYFISDGNTYSSDDFAKIVKEILDKKCLQIKLPKTIVRLISYVSEPISTLLGKRTVLNPDKYKALTCTNWLCDSKNLYKDFNFHAQYPLKKGMKETIAWYQTHGWL